MGLGGLEVTILIHLLIWVPTEIPKPGCYLASTASRFVCNVWTRVQCMDCSILILSSSFFYSRGANARLLKQTLPLLSRGGSETHIAFFVASHLAPSRPPPVSSPERV